MYKRRFLLPVAVAAAGLVLSACELLDDDDVGGQAAQPQSMSAAPSLGLVQGATVNFYRADGTTLLGSGTVGADGTVAIDYPGSYTGPVIVELVGGAASTYFDEAALGMLNTGPGTLLHALVPPGRSSIGVTALTEVAYQMVVAQAVAITEAVVDDANARVLAALAPEVGDLLAVPTLFDGATAAGDLADDAAGRYALRLAGLAQLGAAAATPALTVAAQLAADFADGTLDGQAGASAIAGLVYTPASFAADLQTALDNMAGNYGSAELQAAAAGYDPVDTTIDTGGLGGGGGDSCASPSASEFFASRGGNYDMWVTSSANALADEFVEGEQYLVQVSTDGGIQVQSGLNTYTLSPNEIYNVDVCDDQEGVPYEGYANYRDTESGYSAIFQHQFAEDVYLFNLYEEWQQGDDIHSLDSAYLSTEDPSQGPDLTPVTDLAGQYSVFTYDVSSGTGETFGNTFTEGGNRTVRIDENGNIDMSSSTYWFAGGNYDLFDNRPFGGDLQLMLEDTGREGIGYTLRIHMNDADEVLEFELTEREAMGGGGTAVRTAHMEARPVPDAIDAFFRGVSKNDLTVVAYDDSLGVRSYPLGAAALCAESGALAANVILRGGSSSYYELTGGVVDGEADKVFYTRLYSTYAVNGEGDETVAFNRVGAANMKSYDVTRKANGSLSVTQYQWSNDAGQHVPWITLSNDPADVTAACS